MKITEKIEGKTVTLTLTGKEVETGFSVCEKAGVADIIVMKNHKGAALWYTNERNAANTQQRHNYEYAFVVSKEDLQKNLPQKANK